MVGDVLVSGDGQVGGEPARGGRPVDRVPMPDRIRRLPRTKVGYPIPWFVAQQPDGTYDLRVSDADKLVQAVRESLCWVCGLRLGAFVAFPIGPMCALNKISGEPPAHRECAEYTLRVCPFLVTPGMRRRSRDGLTWVEAAGRMSERNPGAALLWVTRSYQPFRAPLGNDGILFEFGEPTFLAWYREGRPATRAEALEALDAGLPTLLETCELDDDPATSRADVRRRYEQALLLLPT